MTDRTTYWLGECFASWCGVGILLCALFALGGVPGLSVAAPAAMGTASRVVGYYPAWGIYDRGFEIADLPGEKLTHVNYAFANLVGGQCVLGDPWADVERHLPGDPWSGPGSAAPYFGNFHQLDLLQQEHPNLKTLISVGGWTWSGNFSDAALTPASRAQFATSCAEFMEAYSFDGIDIDWEYPGGGGLASNTSRPEDTQNFTLLLQAVRNELDARGAASNRHYLLTIAAPAGADKIANIEVEQIYPLLDFINVMTYDLNGPWSPVSNFNAPLYSSPEDPSSTPGGNADAAIQNYLGRGVPSDKLVLGVPFYGRAVQGVANVNGGLFQSFTATPMGTWDDAGTGATGMFDYADIAVNYLIWPARNRRVPRHRFRSPLAARTVDWFLPELRRPRVPRAQEGIRSGERAGGRDDLGNVERPGRPTPRRIARERPRLCRSGAEPRSPGSSRGAAGMRCHAPPGGVGARIVEKIGDSSDLGGPFFPIGHLLRMNSRVHPKYKTKYRVSNWAEYDRALAQRGDITLCIAEDATDTGSPEPSGKRGGQRKFSDQAIETALVLRLVFQLPLRQAKGFLRSVFSRMALDLEAPDPTTISRRRQHLDIGLRLAATKGRLHLIVDSTGLSIVGEGEWAAAKHGGRGKRAWKKLHLGVDRSGVIVAEALTDGNADDARSAPGLIDEVDGDIASFTADAAYDTTAIYNAAAARGAKVIVPPRMSATRSKRSSARDRTVTRIRKVGRRQWKKESGYHQQARVENTFFRYKSILGDRGPA